jgi:hypothetical protein
MGTPAQFIVYLKISVSIIEPLNGFNIKYTSIVQIMERQYFFFH